MKIHFKNFLMIYVVLVLQCQYRILGEPQVPCLFIFGDSFSDNGNNNNRLTLAMVNYKPYGLDFPEGPTGRATNGRNLPDFIAKNLGFEDYIHPFAKIKYSNNVSEILQGANYASAGGGIRNDTNRLLGQVINFEEQLKNHNYTISKLQSLLGNNNNATTHLKKCLYMVELGTNDYLNYFSSLYTISLQFPPQQFATDLIQQYSVKIKGLYDGGARKFALYGVGNLGCMPRVRYRSITQGSACVEKSNNDVQLFNIALKSLVQNLNANFTDANFIFIDMASIGTLGPLNQGDERIIDFPCCQVPRNIVSCLPFGKVCANRTNYIYWDEVHPTEAPFMELANRSFNAKLPTDTYPYDISHLVQL